MKENKERTDYWFNEGRLTCDRKWQDAINDRIKELEISVGIPELKKLLKMNRYTWKNDTISEEKE
jgi:hypothetical protein